MKIKEFINKRRLAKIKRLEEYQGVLLALVEYSDDEEDREVFEMLVDDNIKQIEKIRSKIK